MPAQYGEIVGYHRREAARHEKLAQEALARKSPGEAEYLLKLAATHRDAALEQEIVIEQEAAATSAQPDQNQKPKERQLSFAARCVLAVLKVLNLAPEPTSFSATKRSPHKHIRHRPSNIPTPDLRA